ncbi:MULTISPECIES: hypothetical protein [unclassified Nodularia (in: cyanobacteria)]|uniref:hypothetical protein n=1 Tax=unclassified Nodularia (in: cyanobacteria) TaxID=2656917 RepID=UPI00188120DA|nr:MULTISPECIES: hypothetical protein [unclassified Nodularia (in: cyanobacteria)]MBE9199811.1 hypothetical protein [Nodularia sp. LEGE 06071]MCC2692784.1 hypothetical protein [Nodularia sp. LEGE 04288]
MKSQRIVKAITKIRNFSPASAGFFLTVSAGGAKQAYHRLCDRYVMKTFSFWQAVEQHTTSMPLVRLTMQLHLTGYKNT